MVAVDDDQDRLVRIDLASATASIVNAGHPPPLRVRAAHVEHVRLKADRPFGLEPGDGYRVQTLQLEVGDRLMFVTDGMLERDAAHMNIAAILTAGLVSSREGNNAENIVDWFKKVRKCLKAGGLDEPNSEQLAVETRPSIVTNIVDYADEKWDRRTPE